MINYFTADEFKIDKLVWSVLVKLAVELVFKYGLTLKKYFINILFYSIKIIVVSLKEKMISKI